MVTREVHERVTEIIELIRAVEPMLAGRGPDVQAAVIAQLAATWLSGFKSRNGMAQETVRAEMLTIFMELVIEMTHVEDNRRGGR